MSEYNGERHALFCLVGSVTKHETLIPRANIFLRAPYVDTLRNVRTLFLQCRQDVTRLVVKTWKKKESQGRLNGTQVDQHSRHRDRVKASRACNGWLVWHVDGMTLRWYDTSMVLHCDATTLRWYDTLIVWHFDGMTLRWYDTSVVWHCDGMMTRRWYDTSMVWHFGGMTRQSAINSGMGSFLIVAQRIPAND